MATPEFHRAVAAELDRQQRKGYTSEHDDQHGLNHLLDLAKDYIARGSTVRGYAMVIAAQAYLQRNTKNSMQRDVEEFMRRCDQEVKTYPELPEEEVKALRIRLMVEELLGSTKISGYPDAKTPEYNPWGLVNDKSDELVQSILNNDLVGIADGLADVLYVVFGTAAAFGIDIQEVFDEVHRSNLSKTVWSEEQQRYIYAKDAGGKTIKPDTYSPADLEPIVQRQIANGKAREEFEADQSHDSELVLGVFDL
ncbi:MazG-like nucleotide pyrophosphohydrolase [Microbacterium phage Count]|nr:MazG-like nucleotide pyrophosphohydrolase [Microbacterium phage Count]